MFVLIWTILLLSAGGSDGDTAASIAEAKPCPDRECVTAEAGLCVVLPCSFIRVKFFTTPKIIWSKCEEKCTDSDIIFQSNVNDNVQPGFRGRVSWLGPRGSENNCGIIINDLKDSDSGSYRPRITGSRFVTPDGTKLLSRVTVSVKGLSEKPTVLVPALTEGHQTTLTCTAPGLCSGSVPEITWTWRPAGNITDSHITGNKTYSKTENLTAVTQRHSSTLTFDPSAEHHGTEVICKVKFTGNMITEETVTLNVTYMKEIKITGNTNVQEGETLRLICSVESFPPPIIKWTKQCHRVKMTEESRLSSGTGAATLLVSHVTSEDAGTYTCTVKHLKGTVTETAAVTVSAVCAAAALPWAVAGVSLSVGVFSLICTLYLWITRQKAKTSHEDGLYMSVQTADRSQEYDVIVKPLK